MRTGYDKTSGFIPHDGNIIDLAELRRRQPQARRDSQACQAGEEARAPEKPPAFHPVVLIAASEERRRARRERCAWRLDVCASLAVILMTVAFALRVLI